MEAVALTHPRRVAPGRRLRSAADADLVTGLRGGDARCFEVLYDRHHLALLSFCRHMLGGREEAEDALQLVFVAAHRQLLADERPVVLKPWLYAIARNRCLSVLRARRDTVALDEVHEPSVDGLAVGAQAEVRQELKDVLADLALLPEEQRAALVLAELGDLSHEEIAVSLGVRTTKVKALIFQARESLIGSRQAREADCGSIQEQLATLRGSALRRSPLRRHVAVCPACTAFEAEVRHQRALLGAVLPVIPALALRHDVLAAVAGGGSTAVATGVGTAIVGGTAGTGAGAAATASTGGGLALAGSSGVAVKVLAAVAVVAAGGGGAVVVQGIHRHAPAAPAPAVVKARPPAPAAARGLGVVPFAPRPGARGTAAPPGLAKGLAGARGTGASAGGKPSKAGATGRPAPGARVTAGRPATKGAKAAPAARPAPAARRRIITRLTGRPTTKTVPRQTKPRTRSRTPARIPVPGASRRRPGAGIPLPPLTP